MRRMTQSRWAALAEIGRQSRWVSSRGPKSWVRPRRTRTHRALLMQRSRKMASPRQAPTHTQRRSRRLPSRSPTSANKGWALRNALTARRDPDGGATAKQRRRNRGMGPAARRRSLLLAAAWHQWGRAQSPPDTARDGGVATTLTPIARGLRRPIHCDPARDDTADRAELHGSRGTSARSGAGVAAPRLTLVTPACRPFDKTTSVVDPDAAVYSPTELRLRDQPLALD